LSSYPIPTGFSATNIQVRGSGPVGIMEFWSNGMMGLKEFFTIKMVYFRLYPQYSIIPSFLSRETFFYFSGAM